MVEGPLPVWRAVSLCKFVGGAKGFEGGNDGGPPVPGDGQTESVQPTSDREGPSGLETDCLEHHGHALADFMTHRRL